MKRLFFAVLLGLACTSYAYAATAPTISVTDSTTTSLTFALSAFDSAQTANCDTLVMVFSTTAADSDGGGTEVVFRSGVTDTTIYSLAPGTLYYLIARADSSGSKAYSNRDTVRVEYPRQQPENWYPGTFFPLLNAQTWPRNGRGAALDSLVVNGESADSTMWFLNAPYLGAHYEMSQVGDSSEVRLDVYQGRIIDDMSNGGDDNYPRVALADSETIVGDIGDMSFSTDIGAHAVYIKAQGLTDNGYNTTIYIWARRHWFAPEVR